MSFHIIDLSDIDTEDDIDRINYYLNKKKMAKIKITSKVFKIFFP